MMAANALFQAYKIRDYYKKRRIQLRKYIEKHINSLGEQMLRVAEVEVERVKNLKATKGGLPEQSLISEANDSMLVAPSY